MKNVESINHKMSLSLSIFGILLEILLIFSVTYHQSVKAACPAIHLFVISYHNLIHISCPQIRVPIF